jgi:uncharacterized coiled-coil protein SlyX
MSWKKLRAGSFAFTFLFMTIAWADEPGQMTEFASLVEELQKQVSQTQSTINIQSEKIRFLERREPQVQIAAPAGSSEPAPPMSDSRRGRVL